MEKVTENGKLRLTVSSMGAEMISLVSKATGLEYIWTGDAAVWPWHSPVLFPQCGSFPGGFMHKGRKYVSRQHGFLRDSEHEETSPGVWRAVHEADGEWPWNCEAVTEYGLEGNTLIHSLTVRNLSDDAMPCSMGFHTAFPLRNAEVVFDRECPVIGSDRFTAVDGLFRPRIDFFDPLPSCWTLSDAAGHMMEVSAEGHSTVVAWTRPGAAGTFISIEPRLDTLPSGGKEPFAVTVEKGGERTLTERISILD